MIPELRAKRAELAKAWEAEDEQRSAIRKEMGWSHARMELFEKRCRQFKNQKLDEFAPLNTGFRAWTYFAVWMISLMFFLIFSPYLNKEEVGLLFILFGTPLFSFLILSVYLWLWGFVYVPFILRRQLFIPSRASEEMPLVYLVRRSIEDSARRIRDAENDLGGCFSESDDQKANEVIEDARKEERETLKFLAELEKASDDWLAVLHSRYSTDWPKGAEHIKRLSQDRVRERRNWYDSQQKYTNPNAKQSNTHLSHAVEPEVVSTVKPEAVYAVEPEIASTVEPEVVSTFEPEVVSTVEPEVVSTVEPEVVSTFGPEVVSADEPEFVSAVEPELASTVGPDFSPESAEIVVKHLVSYEWEPPEPKGDFEPIPQIHIVETKSSDRLAIPRTPISRRKSKLSAEQGPANEGRRKLQMNYAVERNPRLRQAAIDFHGRNCCVCSFNFDAFFGTDLAQGYIEVHHLRSIAEGERTTDPKTDLAPLCGNCHAMADRLTRHMLNPPSSILELKRLLMPTSKKADEGQTGGVRPSLNSPLKKPKPSKGNAQGELF